MSECYVVLCQVCLMSSHPVFCGLSCTDKKSLFINVNSKISLFQISHYGDELKIHNWFNIPFLWNRIIYAYSLFLCYHILIIITRLSSNRTTDSKSLTPGLYQLMNVAFSWNISWPSLLFITYTNNTCNKNIKNLFCSCISAFD